MLFVLAAWICLVLAMVLAWLWLQRVPPPAHGTLHCSLATHARATRTTLRTGALLLALSVALLALHFVAPAREAAADRAWAAGAGHAGGPHANNSSVNSSNEDTEHSNNHSNEHTTKHITSHTTSTTQRPAENTTDERNRTSTNVRSRTSGI